MEVTIRPLEARDMVPIANAFAAMGWNKPAAQYERYLAEQREGRREVLVAFVEDGSAFAGYLTVVWQPDYPPLRAANVPEIQDLNVLPHLRRRGIASRLLDQAERRAALSARWPIHCLGQRCRRSFAARFAANLPSGARTATSDQSNTHAACVGLTMIW